METEQAAESRKAPVRRYRKSRGGHGSVAEWYWLL